MTFIFQKDNEPKQSCGRDVLESCFTFCPDEVKWRLTKFINSKQKRIVFYLDGSTFTIERIIPENNGKLPFEY